MLLLLLACRLTDGMVSKALDPDGDGFGPEEDCAPMDAAVYPGAEEVWYDGVDQSCSGNDFDQDGDGFASAIVPNRDGVLGEDCDDLDGAVNPGAGDVWYDGVDQNCDGADDFDQDGDGVPVGEDCWDNPNDGTFIEQAVGAGLSLTATDVFPDAEEAWYDGVDQNCDGADDFDQDGDGFQSANDERADGGVGEDCVDGSDNDEVFNDSCSGDLVAVDPADAASVNPAATDTYYDGIDQNCDGADDNDADGDGHAVCNECDDTNPNAFPSEIPEVWYDCQDQNCDGNDGDRDGDGYLDTQYTATCTDWATINPGKGDGDCWDDITDGSADYSAINGFPKLSQADVHPDAEDIPYDAVDAACDGNTYEFDADQDGYDTEDEPDRGSALGNDCHDDVASAFPGAAEACDAEDIDYDCDGNLNDPDSLGCVTFYIDSDEDTYGATSSQCLCEAEGTYSSSNSDDCDDSDETVNPAAIEGVGDAKDQNCDNSESCYVDADADGYRDSASTVLASTDADCTDIGEATASDGTGDCDDTNSTINPGEVEICNSGLDEDCSGDINDCGVAGDVLIANADYSYTGTASTNFGYNLASSDWNDDGYMDLAVSAQNAKNVGASSAAGRVYIVYGPLPVTMTFDLEEDAVFEGVGYSDYLGKGIGSGGDLDGDGVDDLIMGAYGYNDGGVSDNGTVALAYGGATWSGTIAATSVDARFYGDLKSNQLGQVTRFIGDVDGDGYDEIALGAEDADNGGANSGAVYIIPGGATRYVGAQAAGSVASVVFAGEVGDQLGDLRSVGDAFDLNADGLADIAMGAVENTTVGTDGGVVYFYYGDSALLYSGALSASGTADARFLPAGANDNLGEGVGAPGDVDGDGYDELLLGAIGYDDPAGSLSFSGGAFLINGSSTLLSGDVTVSTTATATVTGAANSDSLGAWVSGGDLNNDGFDDLVLGAIGYDYGGSSNTGAAFVFYGPVSGALVNTNADAVLAGPATGSAAAMGRAGTVFDADGDGAMDLFVGASSAGTVYGYLGGGL